MNFHSQNSCGKCSSFNHDIFVSGEMWVGYQRVTQWVRRVASFLVMLSFLHWNQPTSATNTSALHHKALELSRWLVSVIVSFSMYAKDFNCLVYSRLCDNYAGFILSYIEIFKASFAASYSKMLSVCLTYEK